MRQGSLWERARAANRTDSGELACAFGEPWMGDHPLCRDETDRLCAAFDEGVKAGVWDEEGYTPAERRHQRKREQQ